MMTNKRLKEIQPRKIISKGQLTLCVYWQRRGKWNPS